MQPSEPKLLQQWRWLKPPNIRLIFFEDQNVLMLFTNLEIGIINEEARKNLQLPYTIELKKLHRKVAKEEEFEKQ